MPFMVSTPQLLGGECSHEHQDIPMKRWARVVDDKVVEEPVALPVTAKVSDFFPTDHLPGDWIVVDDLVHCHYIYDGKQFLAPEIMKPPAPQDPVAKLAAFLAANPDVQAAISAQNGKKK